MVDISILNLRAMVEQYYLVKLIQTTNYLIAQIFLKSLIVYGYELGPFGLMHSPWVAGTILTSLVMAQWSIRSNLYT